MGLRHLLQPLFLWNLPIGIPPVIYHSAPSHKNRTGRCLRMQLQLQCLEVHKAHLLTFLFGKVFIQCTAGFLKP